MDQPEGNPKTDYDKWMSDIVMLPRSDEYQNWKKNRPIMGPRYPPHVYTPLSTTNSFRLFRLMDFDEDVMEFIGCFYQTEVSGSALFESRGSGYVALSYTWGAAVEGHDEELKRAQPWTLVVCERDSHGGRGHDTLKATSVGIGHNLAAFLRAVVHKHRSVGKTLAVEIWIDAICINQGDAAEKQTQIPLMGDIYARADQVLTWLGESKQDWEAFRWINDAVYWAMGDFSKAKGVWESLDIMSEFDPTEDTFWDLYMPSVTPPILGTWLATWEAYWRFISDRRWFRRAWTYQEIILARTSTAICGADYDVLTFDSIEGMAMILHRSRWRLALNSRFRDDKSFQVNPTKFVGVLGQDRLFFSKYLPKLPKQTPATTATQPMSEEEWLERWAKICETLRYRDCFLLEDRIHGSIGIANITRPPTIPADIFKPLPGMKLHELYRWMSTLFLTRGSTLDQLSRVGWQRIPGLLPTWAANYSVPITFEPVASRLQFKASPPRGPDDLTIASHILNVVGWNVCRIKSLGASADRGLSEWCLQYLTESADDTYPWVKKSSQSKIEALWRTMLFDCDEFQNPLDETWGEDFKEWLECHMVIKALFPRLRPSEYLSPQDSWQDTEDSEWWRRHAAMISRLEDTIDPYAPSLSAIAATVAAIKSDPGWEAVAKLQLTAPEESNEAVLELFHQVRHNMKAMNYSFESLGMQEFSKLPLDLPPAPGEADRPQSNSKEGRWDVLLERSCALIPALREVYNKAMTGRFPRRYGQTLYNRCLMETESGYLGVAHRHCRPGDEVWILSGGRALYALRPVRFEDMDARALKLAEKTFGLDGLREGDNRPRESFWTFEGDAYIHGLIEGEYFSEGSGGNAGQKSIVRIC